jgi:hypothetical protein
MIASGRNKQRGKQRCGPPRGGLPGPRCSDEPAKDMFERVASSHWSGRRDWLAVAEEEGKFEKR